MSSQFSVATCLCRITIDCNSLQKQFNNFTLICNACQKKRSLSCLVSGIYISTKTYELQATLYIRDKVAMHCTTVDNGVVGQY